MYFKKIKKILCSALAVTIAVSSVAMSAFTTASAEIASGTCGDNATWSLSDDGVLTIAGTGEVTDNTGYATYASQIKSVVVSEGITSLCSKAFCDSSYAYAITSVSLPSTLTEIGGSAFRYLNLLTSIEIPNSVTTINSYTFQYCTSLQSVTIPESVTTLGICAFQHCTNENLIIDIKTTDDLSVKSSCFNKVVGTIYVYTQANFDAVKTQGSTANIVLYLILDTSELEAAITTAEAIDTSVYTTASAATLTDAITAGKTVLANEDATQDEIDAATTAITDAIDALVTLLAEAIENAESAIEAAEMIDTTNCTEDSAAALTAAIEAAKTAIADESATVDSVEAATEAVNTAVAELEGVIYVTEDEELYNSISSAATSATVVYVADYNSVKAGCIYPSVGTTTLYTLASGTAGSDIAGATSVKVYFDCASDTSYNPYASIDLYAVVNSTQNYAQFKGTDSSYSSGSTGWSETLSLTNAIAEGDTYTISGVTYSWTSAEDYVYAVTKVEFLDASGAVLATVDTTSAEVDVTELKAAIVEADAVDETVYTDNSVATMNEALAAAITVIGNADATQDEVDAATAALTAAIAGLVDTSDLEGTIATAEDIDTSAFTPSSVAAMTEALESAKETLANADVTQDEVNAAVDALTEAINGLTELADTTDLVGTITDAEAVDTSAYTPSSVAALEAALEDAKTVLDNADVTQDEVNAAVDALTEAINGLTELADTTDLETAIADAETVDATLYTSSSVADLTAALEDAKTVLENADATQDEVDAAASALTSAINSLVSAYSITGTVYVSDSDTETTMTVAVTLADGTEVSAEATSMGEYAIEGLDAGTYTITISGGKYAPRSYEVEVSESLTQDVYLNPYGDVNGDGNVTTADVGLANSHAKNVTLLEDYEFVCADVNLDGSVTTADVGKINSHAKGVVALW